MKNIVLHKINGLNYSYRPYGTCEDGSNIADKAVELVSPDQGDTVHEFSLVEGATILVKFSEENNTNGTTLNVNDTGARPVLIGGNELTPSQTWVVGDTIEFRYDGNNWVMLNGEMSIDKAIVKTFYIITDSINQVPELPELNEDGSFDPVEWSDDVNVLGGVEYGLNVLWGATIRLNSRNMTAFRDSNGEFEGFVGPIVATGTKGDNGTFTTEYVSSTKTLKFTSAFNNINLDIKGY